MMYLGADLSFVNELEARGAVYRHNGMAADVFQILRNAGANLVRVRLWHTPTDPQGYSGFTDVARTLRRAKALGYYTLLDFHYSDHWADPAKQIVPAAWVGLDDVALALALRDYTRDTLIALHADGLMPDQVQIGNEINTELMMPMPYDGQPIRWARNASLLNAAIAGVREAASLTQTTPKIMLHVAQPEFLIDWLSDATRAGVHDFDLIGLSYYPKWSTYGLDRLGSTIAEASQCFGRSVMLVEVAYPWTQAFHIAQSHLLGEDGLLPEYPATPEGQRDFLIAVTRTVRQNGGVGVVYWEPAWVSTPNCPSIWENATLFDYSGATHTGITFLAHIDPVRAEE